MPLKNSEPVKIYFSGKITSQSSHAPSNWRERFCQELAARGLEIVKLDPLEHDPDFKLNYDDERLTVGRNSFMIQNADFVLVNLTDDISVGGSQEMLMAKYYDKPLIGLAPKGGKFNQGREEINGHVFTSYTHPYVKLACDCLASTLEEAAEYIKNQLLKQTPPKTIHILNEALQYYKEKHYLKDLYLQRL